MTRLIKKIIAVCSVAVIFFSLPCALCPIDAIAAPKARARAQKQVKQESAQEEARVQEEQVLPVAAQKEAEAPAEKTDKAGGAAGAGNNGFNLYNNYQTEEAEPESYAWLIFKTVFVIGLLVGGFYYFFKFVTRKVGIQMLGRDAVKILSVVPVGQNKYLQVIDLAGRVLVLGVTDSNINLITEIIEKDEIDRIRVMSARTAAPENAPFQEFLAAQLGKLLKKKDAGSPRDARERRRDGDADRLDYLKLQRERLKKISGSDNEV
jgi:flagellar protein FliO/FliZ